MLRPQDTATRERKALDGLWRFRLDVDGVGRAERWFAGPLRGRAGHGRARELQRPARRPAPARPRRRGLVPADGPRAARVGGQRVVLYFESATHRATVWVGDEEVVRHEGGYTPFEADVTAVARRGRARADHRLRRQHAQLPDHPARRRRADRRRAPQRYWHDFYNYAGLHRTVWLACTPAARIEDVTVVTGLDGTTGTVDYRVDAADADGLDVRVVLRDAEGARDRYGDRRGGRGDRARRPSLGARRRLPLRPGGPAGRPGQARSSTATTRASACARSRSAAPSSSSTARRSGSPGSACTRTTRPSARATTPRSWCRTSRCWTGSGPTRSAPRTTPTPRTSSTSPTGTASW